MHCRICTNCALRSCPSTSSRVNSGLRGARTAGGILSPGRRRSPGTATTRQTGDRARRLGPGICGGSGPIPTGGLAAYERLRRRLEERADRLELASPGAEDRLIPFDRDQYAAWLDLARETKRNYQTGRISAGEFLRRIDPGEELVPYDAERTELPPAG